MNITAAMLENVQCSGPEDFRDYAWRQAIEPTEVSLCACCESPTTWVFMVDYGSESCDNDEYLCLWCALGVNGDDLKKTEAVPAVDLVNPHPWFFALRAGFFGEVGA